MITRNLRRTWYDISDYCSGNPNPLRIAEIINRVSPRSWTFRFTFDGTGLTTVRIDCQPRVSDEEAVSLLDGSLQELFHTDTVHLRQADTYASADVGALLDSPDPSNRIMFGGSSRPARSLLALEGFWRSHVALLDIQSGSMARRYFTENTWLGSPRFGTSQHTVRWKVFGTELFIGPANRYKNRLGPAPTFEAKTGLYNKANQHIGEATFRTGPLVQDNGVYTVFGPLDAGLTTLPQRHRWIVEVRAQILEQAVARGHATAALVKELTDSLEGAVSSVTNSTQFRGYEKQLQQKRDVEAANRLRERQERTKTGRSVVVDGVRLMGIPSNENEVIVLLSKLDALRALPFYEFALLEYTAKLGIDAIGSYRIRETDVPTQLAAIELEYHYENFFDHEHPHNQVNLVVCWDFRDGERPRGLRRREGWDEGLFEYRNNESFIVLALSRIARVTIKEAF